MKYCWQIFFIAYTKILFFLLLLYLILFAVVAKKTGAKGAHSLPTCHFPEAEIEPFFFDIRSDTSIDSIIVDTVVDPPDAKLYISNIRSNNLPEIDFIDYFHIENRSSNSGQFFLINKRELQLPHYPSKINETLLYITVNCNKKNIPLITIRVKNINSYTPQFYNEPYEMAILKNSLIGSLYTTPILAMDLDPAENYSLNFSIQSGSPSGEFALINQPNGNIKALNNLPKIYLEQNNDWNTDQLPHLVQLKVLSRLTRSVYYLNVSVSDNGVPEERAYTMLKVTVKNANEITAKFTQKEYFANFTKSMEVGSDLIPNEQIFAIFPLSSSSTTYNIIYELEKTSFSELFSLDPLTARIYVRQSLSDKEIPQNFELQLKAYKQNDPENWIKSTLILNDVTQIKLTYFAQCHYEAHLLENPSTFAKVLQFNYRGDVDRVELLNGTDYFEVNSDGTMLVKYNADIDREKIDRIIVQARLQTSTKIHPKSLELCQIATAEVFVDDYNDHTPRFDKQLYRFYLDLLPYNNTEVGAIHAIDEDKGEFGRVKYRILKDESESLPFVLFQDDGSATIYFSVTESHFYPEKSYTFTVEAYDSDYDARTSRVSVVVTLETEAEMRQRQRKENEEESETTPIAISSDIEANNDDTDDITTIDYKANTTSATKQRSRIHHSKQLRVNDNESDNGLSNQRTRKSSSEIEQEFHETETETDDEFESTQQQQQPHPQQQQQQQTEKIPSKIYLKQLDIAAIATHSNPIKQSVSTSSDLEQPIELPSMSPKSDLRFEKSNYIFSLKGRLDYNDYVGMVQVSKQQTMDEIMDEIQMSTPHEDVQYQVEEGIIGYVEIDSTTGKLTVGPKLIEDSYEEIRFSVAAIDNQQKILDSQN